MQLPLKLKVRRLPLHISWADRNDTKIYQLVGGLVIEMCLYYIYTIYNVCIDTCLYCVVYIIYRHNLTKKEPPEENPT